MTNNLESKTKYQWFDAFEWIPFGVGMIEYIYNSVNETNEGLYITGVSSLVNNIHSLYQAGTITSLIFYIYLNN